MTPMPSDFTYTLKSNEGERLEFSHYLVINISIKLETGYIRPELMWIYAYGSGLKKLETGKSYQCKITSIRSVSGRNLLATPDPDPSGICVDVEFAEPYGCNVTNDDIDIAKKLVGTFAEISIGNPFA